MNLNEEKIYKLRVRMVQIGLVLVVILIFLSKEPRDIYSYLSGLVIGILMSLNGFISLPQYRKEFIYKPMLISFIFITFIFIPYILFEIIKIMLK